MDAQLHISDDEKVIGPVCEFTYQWCLQSGLDSKDALHFTVAVSELISNIIQFAYPYERQAFFDISFSHSLSNIELIVSEVGEPFDPDLHPYNVEEAIEDGNFEGAGFRIIRRFTDDFLFINKGKEGKEFRLLKFIELSVLDALMERSKAQQQQIDRDIEKAAEVEDTYDTHEITAIDAEDIAKLIYRTYGYSYVKEDMYFPKKIEKTLNSKDKLGVITRNQEGEAVGYFAILKSSDSNIGEVGEAVVSPDHRRRGIMSKMMEFLIQTAKDQELDGLFGKAVTTHPVSQRVNRKYGFVSAALMLAQFNKLKFKGFEDYPQPISEIIDFLPLNKEDKKKVYLPAKYKEILAGTYKELDLPVEIEEYPAVGKLASKSDVELLINYSESTSLIIVNKYGPDYRTVLYEMINSLEKQESLNTIYLDLPLENKVTPEQFKKLKGLGFIYCGLVPFFHQRRDFLRLQKVYAKLDLDLVEVITDFGKKIKSIITDEYHGNKE